MSFLPPIPTRTNTATKRKNKILAVTTKRKDLQKKKLGFFSPISILYIHLRSNKYTSQEMFFLFAFIVPAPIKVFELVFNETRREVIYKVDQVLLMALSIIWNMR